MSEFHFQHTFALIALILILNFSTCQLLPPQPSPSSLSSSSDASELDSTIIELPNKPTAALQAPPAVGGPSASLLDDCDPEMIGFELITGYVFSSPGNVIDSIPGTLMLTECLETCQGNESCQSVNYETGLCVLFGSNADVLPGALTKSQFPVFTIYAQKNCLGVKPCERAWCIDRVQNYRLSGYVKGNQIVASRQECLELCLGENEFACRSANFNNGTGDCELSTMDRITLTGINALIPAEGYEYMENNCIEEPTKLCEFKKLSGRILKTVDSVYQDVGSVDECRELCLNSLYRCHSYDYGDTGEMVCRLSHHTRATLTDIQDPYLEVREASTYELSSCYNVSIDCGSGDMVARIQTSKIFDGKIYAKGSPNSCVQDVNHSLQFELSMAYDNLECNVRKNGLGKYINDIVIQHHDKIITSSDLGLAVTCQYDLTNKSVTNEVDLAVQGDITPFQKNVVVDSPNVAMRITERNGEEMRQSAEVGDPLALKFEIIDKNSPYEIFVRELVALDGVDSSEIVLIDSNGCPTDHFIMGPIYKSSEPGKVLLSHFDAFKFPSSEVVQFRALVTPCMPSCEPVQCDQEEESTGELRSVTSYGKRRRRRRSATASSSSNQSSAQDDLLLYQSIQITDKFGFNKDGSVNNQSNNEAIYISNNDGGFCINTAGIIGAAILFLGVQLMLILTWSFIWQRIKYNDKLCHHDTIGIPSPLSGSGTDSLCKLYENGLTTLHSRRF